MAGPSPAMTKSAKLRRLDLSSESSWKIDRRESHLAAHHFRVERYAEGCRRYRLGAKTMVNRLEKAQWQAYFDGMAQALLGKRAEIEIDSLMLGHQIEAEWLPLLGISYDPKDDIIDIALEGVDHRIQKPQEIFLEGEGLELSSLEIVDAEGVHQIVVLRDALLLPAQASRNAR
jgi:hypothetical protein